jgi:hypothetical protein
LEEDVVFGGGIDEEARVLTIAEVGYLNHLLKGLKCHSPGVCLVELEASQPVPLGQLLPLSQPTPAHNFVLLLSDLQALLLVLPMSISFAGFLLLNL